MSRPLNYLDKALLTCDGAIGIQSLVMRGDTGSGGDLGFVPPPKPGDAANDAFLRADGQWEQPWLGAQWLFAIIWS